MTPIAKTMLRYFSTFSLVLKFPKRKKVKPKAYKVSLLTISSVLQKRKKPINSDNNRIALMKDMVTLTLSFLIRKLFGSRFALLALINPAHLLPVSHRIKFRITLRRRDINIEVVMGKYISSPSLL